MQVTMTLVNKRHCPIHDNLACGIRRLMKRLCEEPFLVAGRRAAHLGHFLNETSGQRLGACFNHWELKPAISGDPGLISAAEMTARITH